eukprot:UN02470
MAANFLKSLSGGNNNNLKNKTNVNPFGVSATPSNPFAQRNGANGNPFGTAIRLDNTAVQQTDFLGGRKTLIQQQQKEQFDTAYADIHTTNNDDTNTN